MPKDVSVIYNRSDGFLEREDTEMCISFTHFLAGKLQERGFKRHHTLGTSGLLSLLYCRHFRVKSLVENPRKVIIVVSPEFMKEYRDSAIHRLIYHNLLDEISPDKSVIVLLDVKGFPSEFHKELNCQNSFEFSSQSYMLTDPGILNRWEKFLLVWLFFKQSTILFGKFFMLS